MAKDGNGLFNDALKTFLFTVILSQTYGKRRKEGFNLTQNIFIYIYIESDMVKEGRKGFI